MSPASSASCLGVPVVRVCRLACTRPQIRSRQGGWQQRQQQQWCRRQTLPSPPAVVCRAGGGRPRRSRQQPTTLPDPSKLLQQYGLPALGLLVAASLVGPLLGGLVMTALGLGVAIAATAAALSISWVAVPFIVAVFGVPALMAGGMAAGVFATAAAGALLLPGLIQLVLIGGGLWLGATAAQQLFYGGSGRGGSIDPDGTIDVEAETVDNSDWRKEVFKERQEREAELREFDELLRRREEFKQRRPGPPYS